MQAGRQPPCRRAALFAEIGCFRFFCLCIFSCQGSGSLYAALQAGIRKTGFCTCFDKAGGPIFSWQEERGSSAGTSCADGALFAAALLPAGR